MDYTTKFVKDELTSSSVFDIKCEYSEVNA